MTILPSQHKELADFVKASTVAADVEPDYTEAVIWRYKPNPYVYAFLVKEASRSRMVGVGEQRGYSLTITPGEKHHEETFFAPDWPRVRVHFAAWLKNLERERRAEELGADSGPVPDWLAGLLPTRIGEIQQEIQKLRRERNELTKISGLFWQTGQSLNEAVRDAFQVCGYKAQLTDTAETYDVTVELSDGKRLLIEVTGIDDTIRKSSNKIAQILQTSTKIAKEQDRVVLAVNAHRTKSPAERASLNILTPDAADLLVGLKAVIVTTVTLHKLVELAATDLEAAKRRVEQLYAAPPGLFA